MIPQNKILLFFWICCAFFTASFHATGAVNNAPANNVPANNAPAVETILQKGFPVKADELEKTTDSLFQEYESQKNISSLVFYSYGMLRLANHFSQVNDFVRASEYAKTGFFYLDEAVDLYEDNPRVRYLRARVDAYLPANLGRCVVTLYDTDILLKEKTKFDKDILAQINYMRYRALYSCKEYKQADALLAQIKEENPNLNLLSLGVDGTPEWDVNEVTQVMMPLVKGE
ncbi:MAG: hypothetical protein LBN41_06685 [Enterobacteriaceae bacterium]|jgi:hypothetical protein|nr:hypothetical protein [Enterobacteriaceae bacterium]